MKKVGVIIGRFMCDVLHAGHINFIQRVFDLSDEVVCFLGTSVTKTRKNPLDFETRRLMMESEFPNLKYILPQKDNRSDIIWSNTLDESIANLYFNENVEVILYGSRDSFIPHYSGRYKTQELKEIELDGIAASHIRQSIAETPINSADFRRGIIYDAYNRYPTSYQCCDLAILDDDGMILLGRKPNESKFRFIGGFVDVEDKSLEDAIRREAQEEIGNICLDQFEYVQSCRISDWRYLSSGDGIMTAFFKCRYIYGHPKASDDIEMVKWFDLSDPSLIDNIMPEHVYLFEKLQENLEKVSNDIINHLPKGIINLYPKSAEKYNLLNGNKIDHTYNNESEIENSMGEKDCSAAID